MQSFEDRLKEAEDLLARAEAAAAASTETLRAARLKGVSQDRSVEATVGAGGELLDLRFLNQRFQSMAGPQLAATILDAVGQARRKAADAVVDAVRPLEEMTPVFDGMPGAEGGVQGLFKELLAQLPPEPGRRPAADGHLRDEIDDEDAEDGGGHRPATS
ncbi:YbaB/EbfC family nucleoid-associated protein [Streptomyces sp. NPDC035033]|uniref:YbaB/EbfC family nucleoid-associated protein n=1 Tax=Streptomyces sp. NPDC035033 TaxID=3155368 RepID=UPI0033C278B1